MIQLIHLIEDAIDADWLKALRWTGPSIETEEQVEAAFRWVKGTAAEIGLKRHLEGRESEPLSTEDVKLLDRLRDEYWR